MRKLIAVGAIAATTVTLAVAGTTLAQTAAGTPRTHHSAARSYTPPNIKWHKCTAGEDKGLHDAGAQCGYLIVPMDYAHPKGTKIKVAVSRLKHKTKTSKGIMLVNPGGPGGAGRYLATLQGAIPNGAGNAYDWIGFDPRGVGASIPELSCDKNFSQGPRPPYRPTSKKIMREWIARSKHYARDCVNSPHSALFRHVKTIDTIRDMESIRKALHRKKINYYGFSYGTYLGTVYMSLHPHRVGRFVLDSTVDPRRVWYKSNLDQDVAFQRTFTIYFKYLAKYHSIFHVGDTLHQVRKLWLATQAKLNHHPIGALGGDEFTDVFTDAGYYVYDWATIGQEYSAYINQHDAGPLTKDYTSNNPTTKDYDNGYAMYLATQCTDAPWPQSQARLNRDSRKYDKKYFYLTWPNAWFNGPCAYWHYKPANHLVHVTGRHVHVPVLMIDETFDPATPYEGSLYVRKIFPTASLVEGKDGTTHAGSLSGVKCTDDTIARYLRTGKVPTRKAGNHSDKVCPPVPPPTPVRAGNATARPNAVAARPGFVG